MDSMSALMAVKVLGIVALGALFVWWQFRDLAREQKRSAARRAALESTDVPPP
jgi:type II secretory pathway pseudopilin PulG